MDERNKPKKTIRFIGQEIRLYGSETLAHILGRKLKTLSKIRKQKLIPAGFFSSGHILYYTEYELATIKDCLNQVGYIRTFSTTGKYAEQVEKFRGLLEEKFKAIHTAIENGQRPDMPLHLKFDSKDELQAVLYTTLRPYGLTPANILPIMDKLLNHLTY